MPGNIYVGVGGKLFAAIGVTYPVGATLTCTNGSRILKAKNTSGQWVFAIPSAGTWTVTATDGVDTVSKSVAITNKNQLEKLNLIYPYLYKNGNEYTDVTGGWTGLGKKSSSSSSATAAAPTITRGANSITAEFTASRGGIFHCANLIDLTDVSTITVKGSFVRGGTSANNLIFSIWSSFGSYYLNNRVAYVEINTGFSQTITLDVSALTGSYYVGFGMTANGTTVTLAEVEIT